MHLSEIWHSKKNDCRLSRTQVNILIERYGIAPSRIEAQGIGSNAQPYEDNDLNRVVIVIALPE